MLRLTPENKGLPYALYRAEQVRGLDRRAIEHFGIPGIELMERAGAAAFGLLRERWPDARRVAVLAGAGNNGGDGYVIARLARERGLEVRLLGLGDHDHLHGEAAQAAGAFTAAGGTAEAFRKLPVNADVFVDALLGTGLERPVRDDWAAAVDALNAARAPVLAVDIPSGLHADTGRVMGTAVEADVTVSFIGLKQGLFTARGPDYCGEVRFDALGVPAAVYAGEILSARRLDWIRAASLLPRRRRAAHKGDCGHVLVVGGAPGMSGAPRLSAEAALRSGAGLVSIATDPAHAGMAALTRPELMVHGIGDTRALAQVAARADVIALGPGLGAGGWSRELFDWCIARDGPKVVDADALNLLAQAPVRRDDWVLTPHPGEAGRLLGCSPADIEHDRFAAVDALQSRYGGVIVLKGAGTLVKGASHRPTGLCSDGNPGMASAGVGDALTGVIAALLGQGMDPEDAAAAGVCLHGAAGDLAARDGARGMLAGDLINALRTALALSETDT